VYELTGPSFLIQHSFDCLALWPTQPSMVVRNHVCDYTGRGQLLCKEIECFTRHSWHLSETKQCDQQGIIHRGEVESPNESQSQPSRYPRGPPRLQKANIP
jgi:hypothetical protein